MRKTKIKDFIGNAIKDEPILLEDKTASLAFKFITSISVEMKPLAIKRKTKPSIIHHSKLTQADERNTYNFA